MKLGGQNSLDRSNSIAGTMFTIISFFLRFVLALQFYHHLKTLFKAPFTMNNMAYPCTVIAEKIVLQIPLSRTNASTDISFVQAHGHGGRSLLTK